MTETIRELSELLGSKAERNNRGSAMTDEEFEKHSIEKENQRSGKLTGYDCPICRNKGYYFRYDSEHRCRIQVRCECMPRREAIERLNRSGLSEVMQKMTFDTYQTNEDWTRRICAAAKAYAANPAGWFFIGGQVGAGKTHICTAILMELSKKYDVHYMLWRDEYEKIKSVQNDPAGVAIEQKLKNVKILYIDDLFKCANRDSTGKLRPNPGETRLAFQLLNYRYNRDDLFTIISTELFIDDLIQIDEGVGSRIAERSKAYRLEVARDLARNRRTSY